MAPCVRCLFFTFNLLVWIFGIIVVVAGVVNQGEAGLFVISNLLIGVGCLVTLLGFLGCCGAIKKIRSMLTGYFLFVLVLFFAEVSLGVCVYLYRGRVVNTLVAEVQHAITNRYAKGDKTSLFITVAIDLYQQEMHCCGIKGPYDYHDSYWQNASSVRNVTVPTSCCIKRVKGCNVDVLMYKYSWITNETIIVKNHNAMPRNHPLKARNRTHRFRGHTLKIGNNSLRMTNHTTMKKNHTTMKKNHTILVGNDTTLVRNHTKKNLTMMANGTARETENRTIVMVKHTIMTTNDTRIYKTGCLKQSKVWIETGKWKLVEAAVTIGVIEVIGIVCAICLWCSFGNEKGGKKKK